MVTPQYDHIWDCCCDHGLLGASLLSKHAAPIVHFVDIIPKLIADLSDKLAHFYPNTETKWLTHCLDVATLPIEQYQGRHLIILAGVGGDLMTHFITSIHQRFRAQQIDFLLCPVHHQFTLRQRLIELKLSLKREALVEENKRFYEVLLVSTSGSGAEISPIGSEIWITDNPQQKIAARRYLDKRLKHYQRIQRCGDIDAQKIVNAYSSLPIYQPQ